LRVRRILPFAISKEIIACAKRIRESAFCPYPPVSYFFESCILYDLPPTEKIFMIFFYETSKENEIYMKSTMIKS
jgi:hypothetical protein